MLSSNGYMSGSYGKSWRTRFGAACRSVSSSFTRARWCISCTATPHEADAVVAPHSKHGLVAGLHGERRVEVLHEQGVFDLRRLAHEPDQLEVRVLEVTNDVRRRGPSVAVKRSIVGGPYSLSCSRS